MAAKSNVAAVSLFAFGFVLLFVGASGSLTGALATVLSVGGIALLFVAAVWIDVFDAGSILEPELDRRKLLRNAVSVLGALLFMAVLFRETIPERLRITLGAIGLVVLLGSAYWYRWRSPVDEYDERERQIRYRAASTAFLVLNGMLFAALFVAYAAGRAATELTGATAVPIGAALMIVGGGVVFKLSEGWYRAQM
ncbi:hypothetical protein GRX03_06695 [Halovenus sp. WSH3]|uniref:Uncharacterized protein n=1 Tax=Halovenus carboxidivorans TaxID=2692199 RepID=A0A6B0T7L4_9EURY|nr:hypothetical protein [Halovenus carboxidivorans]MXR51292.1 hypothetical protein [Halovenus carboxidivorans]